MKESAFAILAACSISSCVASSFPKRMFSATVPVNRWVSCSNDTEGVAQSVFFDIFYVNAVVDNRAALDVVETVDQVRDRRFSGSCGTDKSNFLAWFGIQADVL